MGTVAHDLGHLLSDWDDHDRRAGIGADWLMDTGGADAIPAWPCAPTRLAAGWLEPNTAARTTMDGDLINGRVVAIGTKLIERGPSGDVLVFDGCEHR